MNRKRLRERVKELEFIICEGKHDWKNTGELASQDWRDFSREYYYKCTKCGKVKVGRE